MRALLALIAMLACAGGNAALAQEKTLSLSAMKVSLVEPSIYKTIWQDAFDKELALRKELSAKTKRPVIATVNVFQAIFEVPEGQVIVSSTGTPEVGCRTYQSIGLSSKLITCPVRVALVRNKGPAGAVNEPKVVYSKPDYTFVLNPNSRGEFDNGGEKVRTLLTLNSTTKSLFTHLDDETAPKGIAPSANDSTIKLSY